ncbi:hypothetical protein HaLaN_11307, partial [Haematococcus lacustris]
IASHDAHTSHLPAPTTPSQHLSHPYGRTCDLICDQPPAASQLPGQNGSVCRAGQVMDRRASKWASRRPQMS